MKDPADLTASAAAAAIAARRLSPLALAEACIARIAQRESTVRAFRYFDPGQFRQAAAAARPGPLSGVPFAVKDVLDTADMPTGYGSPIWAGHRPRSDAFAVGAARSAGAVIMGKTVTTEFATRFPGPTTNPHNHKHTPGGSSSGSAAAVACGMVPLAFGTQTAGSIIRPAAYCGVVGFKPTFGTLHRAGMKVCSESLDTIGVMARSVADCALAISALTGRDLGNPDAMRPSPPRLGLTLGHAPEAAQPETIARLHEVADLARKAGAEVVDFDLPEPVIEAAAHHPILMNLETRQALAWELAGARPQLSTMLRERMDWAAGIPPAKLDEARFGMAMAVFAFVMATQGFDGILTPAAPGEAPEGIQATGEPTFNLLWTLLCGPAITIPAGNGPKGLPLGVQLVGRLGSDAALLGTARWLQAAIA